MTRRRLFWLAGAAIVGIVAWFALNHRTPAGQPPLFEISEANFSELRTTFNRTAEARLVLLLSPT